MTETRAARAAKGAKSAPPRRIGAVRFNASTSDPTVPHGGGVRRDHLRSKEGGRGGGGVAHPKPAQPAYVSGVQQAMRGAHIRHRSFRAKRDRDSECCFEPCSKSDRDGEEAKRAVEFGPQPARLRGATSRRPPHRAVRKRSLRPPQLISHQLPNPVVHSVTFRSPPAGRRTQLPLFYRSRAWEAADRERGSTNPLARTDSAEHWRLPSPAPPPPAS